MRSASKLEAQMEGEVEGGVEGEVEVEVGQTEGKGANLTHTSLRMLPGNLI